MQDFRNTIGRQTPQRDLILLLIASIATVLAITTALVDRNPVAKASDGLEMGSFLLIALIALVALAGVYAVIKSAISARRNVKSADTEIKKLRRELLTAEALIKAEPQVLIYWDQGRPPVVVTHALSAVPGLPQNEAALLRYGMWLDAKSADTLKESLGALFAEGTPFNIILSTSAGGYLEADGRAAGGRAVLRFRDVAGYKRDLGLINERHALLARDIRSGRALLDALPHPVWLKAANDRLVWVNKAYLKAVDASSEDEVVAHQIELLESRQRKAVDRVLKLGRPFRERLALVIGEERKSHDVVVLPLGDATAGAAIDVDALIKAQGNLDRQVAAFDRTLDRVATAVALFNSEKSLTFFNEAYLKMWPLDRNWLQTGPSEGAVLDRMRELRQLPEVVHYREWKSKLIASYTTNGSHEDWWHLPDSRIVHVLIEQRPDGGVAYLFDDQTERYALESRYNSLIGVQSETLNSLKEGVAVFATDGRLKLFNTAFAAIWKQSLKSLAEAPHIEPFVETVRILCDDMEAWGRIKQAVTSFSDHREQIEGQMLRADGSVIDYAAIPLPDGGTLVTFADVTDSKRYERALEERNEALVAADKLKNQFIGHISYQLRTPLTAIIGFSDLLSAPFTGELNPKQREYVDDISSSSRTLLTIIDQILDLSTIDAGTMEIRQDRIEVRPLIDAAVASVQERADRAHLTLDIDIADDVEHFTGDEDRVRQVLSNLISNAIGFSREKSLVSICCWREAGYIAFRVEDWGVGIPKELQGLVFDRFESRSFGSNHRGAGLGLSIVKSLVELHGGTMTLVSEPGKGTQVTVRFPEHGKTQAGSGDSTRHDPYLERKSG
jgi:signal transduction histidine kinase